MSRCPFHFTAYFWRNNYLSVVSASTFLDYILAEFQDVMMTGFKGNLEGSLSPEEKSLSVFFQLAECWIWLSKSPSRRVLEA